MFRASRLAVISVATLTSLATAAVANAEPALTYQRIAAMSPADQAAIMDPLRAVANAAGAVGRAEGSGVFAGIQIDAPSHTVTIYVTDLKQEASFRAAMQRIDRAVDLGPARFKQGAYAITALTAAADKLMSLRKQYNLSIESIAVEPDGSALRVRAYDVAQAKRGLASLSTAIGYIPMIVEQAAADVTNLSRR